MLTRYVMIRDGKKTIIQGLFGKINDPEEYAKVAVYVDLIDRYGYSVNQIEVDAAVPNSKEGVDIMVCIDEEKKKPYIVIECRKENISEVEFEQGVKQAVVSARLLKASFAVCVSGDRRRIIALDKKRQDVAIDDLPKNLTAEVGEL